MRGAGGTDDRIHRNVGDLQPAGEPTTLDWIGANVDPILVTVERLYSVATQDFPGSDEFLNRMAWLLPLLQRLNQSVPLDGN